jgi:hypothetical protein
LAAAPVRFFAPDVAFRALAACGRALLVDLVPAERDLPLLDAFAVPRFDLPVLDAFAVVDLVPAERDLPLLDAFAAPRFDFAFPRLAADVRALLLRDWDFEPPLRLELFVVCAIVFTSLLAGLSERLPGPRAG